jgi:hypothetical protein
MNMTGENVTATHACQPRLEGRHGLAWRANALSGVMRPPFWVRAHPPPQVRRAPRRRALPRRDAHRHDERRHGGGRRGGYRRRSVEAIGRERDGMVYSNRVDT